MNLNRFGRGLLFALLAVRLGWAQEVLIHVESPSGVHARFRLDVAHVPAISASQSARPTVGDPGSTGGVPSGVHFGPGPDGTGGIPGSLGSVPFISTNSSQSPAGGRCALLGAGPDADEVLRGHTVPTNDPGGAG